MDRFDSIESHKLLELSEKSDSELDLPDFINVPRKKKVRRKVRSRNKIENVSTTNNCTCNIWVVTVWIATLLLTTWIISLTWLSIIFRNELQRLDNNYREVVASSQGVPEALQRCHTISKNLQENQTLILGQLTDLKQQVENLTKEVRSVQTELNKIQEKLKNAPEYVQIPTRINEVSDSVANLGSQIKDLTTTVMSLKDNKQKIDTITTTLQSNVTDLTQSVSQLQSLTQAPVAADNRSNVEIQKISKVVDDLKNNVSTINNTLSNKIQWLYDDQSKDHKNVDLLSEMGQNMSARVTTLEGICAKCASDEITLRTNVTDITKHVDDLNNKVEGMSLQLPVLQSQYRQLSSNNTELQTELGRLLEKSTESNSPSPVPIIPTLDENKSKLVSSTPITPTTTVNSKPKLLNLN